MQKLTIVVNCTDRKSVTPAPDLRIQSLPAEDLPTRFDLWRHRLATAHDKLRLRYLYQGEAWVQATCLAGDIRNQGACVRMLVASAGLGLREVTELAPAYSATFATGHPDSVAADSKGNVEWWELLATLPSSRSVDELTDGPTLLVLSENYARAMDQDLVALANQGGDYLLVGGWRTITGLPRLPVDRDLRQALGGTVSSLGLRMARRWMATRSRSHRLFDPVDHQRWTQWAASVRKPEKYDRTPRTDVELMEIITELLNEEPTLSATRALRVVRDSGIACEQKRFARLFRDVVECR
mgnify:CR=1 FL=1